MNLSGFRGEDLRAGVQNEINQLTAQRNAYQQEHTVRFGSLPAPHHKLGALMLFACESAYEYRWAKFVSENGVFLGFGAFSGINIVRDQLWGGSSAGGIARRGWG